MAGETTLRKESPGIGRRASRRGWHLKPALKILGKSFSVVTV